MNQNDPKSQPGSAFSSNELLGVLPQSREWTIGRSQIDYGWCVEIARNVKMASFKELVLIIQAALNTLPAIASEHTVQQRWKFWIPHPMFGIYMDCEWFKKWTDISDIALKELARRDAVSPNDQAEGPIGDSRKQGKETQSDESTN